MTARGLTLIEVLIATLLLATIAAAVTPWLREARRVEASQSDAEARFRLERLADAVVADPAAFGLDESVLATGGNTGIITPQPVSELSPVSYSVLTPADPEQPRRWVTFRSEPSEVFRWVAVPIDEAEGIGAP